MFKKIWLLFISILVIIFTILLITYLSPNKISPIGSVLTEEQMLMDIERLAKENNLNSSTPKIFFNGINPYLTFKSRSGDVNKNSKVLSFGVTNKYFEDASKPLEVNYAINIWTYLRERKLPFEIDWLALYFKRNNYFEGESIIIISKSDFEELYKEAKVEGLDKEQQITKLAELWIKKHNYKRNGLKN